MYSLRPYSNQRRKNFAAFSTNLEGNKMSEEWLNAKVYIVGQFEQGVWKVSSISMEYLSDLDANNCLKGIRSVLIAIIYQKRSESPVMNDFVERKIELSKLIKAEKVSELVEELWRTDV